MPDLPETATVFYALPKTRYPAPVLFRNGSKSPRSMRTSSLSSTQSTKYHQRDSCYDDVFKVASALRRRASTTVDTPFDAHLEDIYAGLVSGDDGLAFFESHGYYDVTEANTVEMFRQNFGMEDAFWEGSDDDMRFIEQNVDTFDVQGIEVLSVGSLLTKKVKRNRTFSGRFQLLDEQGQEIDAEAELEREKEKRIKRKSLELDEDDLAELEQEQVGLAEAIVVIKSEQTRFKQYFYEVFNEEAVKSAPIAMPQPSQNVQLPPYAGYMYVLKDSVPHLFRSWHKRWLRLDFNAGVLKMYKRSFWKKEKGIVDIRLVTNIQRMNQADVRVECSDGRSILMRSRLGADDADMWVNLLRFARRQLGFTDRTSLIAGGPANAPSTSTSMALQTRQPSRGVLISTKHVRPIDPMVRDMMAILLASRLEANVERGSDESLE